MGIGLGDLSPAGTSDKERINPAPIAVHRPRGSEHRSAMLPVIATARISLLRVTSLDHNLMNDTVKKKKL
jgi:hypothetical protein